MENNKKNNLIISFVWKLLERAGTSIVQFIIQLMLARILVPEDYGIVAIVIIFINLANVFVQTGFNTSLIQKKEVDDLDYSSVFYLSLLISFILYIIIFISSPYIANFYSNDLISNVLRILALTLFLGAYNSIQNAFIARNMLFKKNFYGSFLSIIISGIVGIVFAKLGFGVWSLVIQQLLNMFLLVVILTFLIDWKPKLMFSFNRTKILFSYGWKLLCSSLIETLYNNVYDLIIGKKYTTNDLAFYNRGKQFPYLIINNINGAISTVLLPALSIEQDNKENVKKMVRNSIMMSSFLIFPLLFGLMVIARSLVLLLLTEKWLECVPFLQILCLGYMLWPIHTANLQAINAIGRSDVFLKLEIIKKIIGILVIFITIPMGVYAMAIGQVLVSLISSFINAFPNKKLLNYGYFEQIKDIMPSFIISIIMAFIISLVSLLKLNSIITIILQIIFGVIIYLISSYFSKSRSLQFITDKIKKNN